MIISHRLKFAFFRAPKTGSTTTEIMLRICGVFDPALDIMSGLPRFGLPGIDDNQHMTPAEAIAAGHLTIEQAREYDMYATLRDPLARAVSIFGHATARLAPITNSAEAFALKVKDGKDFGLLEKRQVEYFFVAGEQVCEPVEFADFVTNLKGLIASIGGLDFPVIPNFNVRPLKSEGQNRTNFVDDNSDPAVEIILRNKFADDIAFYESYYGTI